MAQTVSCTGGQVTLDGEGFHITAELTAGQSLEVCVFAALYKDTDPDWGDSVSAVLQAKKQGFDDLLRSHREAWNALWRRTGVDIEGDDQAQLALRHSMYLLLVSTPFHTDRVGYPRPRAVWPGV